MRRRNETLLGYLVDVEKWRGIRVIRVCINCLQPLHVIHRRRNGTLKRKCIPVIHVCIQKLPALHVILGMLGQSGGGAQIRG